MAFKKIIRVFLFIYQTKKVWRKPKSAKVVIYDRSGSEAIIKYLKDGITHVLDTRGESINIFILLKTIFSGSISMSTYFEMYIKFVNPDVIITFVDNNPRFYTLNHINPNLKTVFIQNGYRGEFTDVFELLECDRESNFDYNVDYMFVFGKAIADKYKQYIKGNTIIIGSFLNNEAVVPIQQKNKSVLFISQYRKPSVDLSEPMMYRYGNPITYDDFFYPEKWILPLLFKYCDSNELKLTVLGNSLVDQEKERSYFTKLIGPQKWWFIPREIGVSNYSFLDKFGIIVFIDSTMGYEALARGYKTVAFSLRGKILQTKGHNFGWPLDLSDNGPFWSNTESVEEFHRVLNFIKNVSDNEWSRLIEKYVNSLITIDPENDKFKTVMKQLNIYKLC